jgi:hypothetical protein
MFDKLGNEINVKARCFSKRLNASADDYLQTGTGEAMVMALFTDFPP